jgi:hypothetical protein
MSRYLIILIILLSGCSTFKKEKSEGDKNNQIIKKKRINPNAEERAEAVRDSGLTIFGKKAGENSGTVSFKNANVLWRASLETLDFMPIESIDYAGGVISTDWYKDKLSDKNEIKIRIEFVSNELSPNSFKVFSHTRTCETNLGCKVNKSSSKLVSSISEKIITKARELNIEKEKNEKK